jgi:hypothetical protein
MSNLITRGGDVAGDTARAVASAEATLLGAIERQWRLWQQYLYARTLELGGTADDTFDIPLEGGARASDPPAQQARQLLDTLPAEARKSFDRYLEQQRQAAQAEAEAALGQEHPDPDAVLAELLARLREAARGDAEGQAEVPYQDTVYLLDLHSLATPLTDEDLLALARPARWDRRRLALGAGLLALIAVGAALALRDFARQDRSGASDKAPPALLVADAPVTALAPRWLRLAGADTRWQLGQIDAVGGALPDQAAGAWVGESLAPMLVCLRPELAEAAFAALQPGKRLALDDADGGQHLFRVVDTPAPGEPGNAADLALTICGEMNTRAPRVVARLDSYQPPPLLAPGDTAPLASGGSLTLDGVEARSAELDPSLPPATMAIDLVVFVEGAVDPLALRPELLLADGSLVPLSNAVRDGDLAVLTFLLPSQPHEQPAVWRLSEGDGSQVRWSVALPPAPTRDTLLATIAASVEAAHWQPGDPPQLTISVALHNTSGVALRLLPEDLTATQGRHALPILGADSAGQELAPNATLVLSFGIQARDETPLTVGVGPLRWEIDPSRQEGLAE